MRTLLRYLLDQREWRDHDAFLPYFKQAARELADFEGKPSLATLAPAKATFEAWYYGKRQPQRDARRVLVRMFGYSIEQLWSEVLEGTTPAPVPLFGTPQTQGRTEVGMDLHEMRRTGAMAARRAMDFAEPRSRADVEQTVARSIASATATPRTEYAVAIAERMSNEVIGFGRLAMDPHQQRAATFGFALRPNAWGMGYGIETIELLLGLGFEDLNLHRVWSARSPLNEASARTMQKAGMVEEGRIREHIEKGAKWRDSIVHSILEHEWRSRAPKTNE
ncbi:GNAT family N-acetyltransferase [Streptomyces sp. NPDC059866]|uniref:GNAT family N-acetyltransferase n=1 Tax=Streptomyces sp. NPDC059866 TaxID=3346978 RepID=UPI00365A701E